jgi:hypothetical protein
VAYRLKASASELQAHGKHPLAPYERMRHEHLPGGAEAMAISFPVPESANEQQTGRGSSERGYVGSLITGGGRVLRGCYERAYSAIFNADGDCMRF